SGQVVELVPELFHQECEVLRVVGVFDVVGVPIAPGPLPVQGDAVEDTAGRSFAALGFVLVFGQVTAQPQVQAGGHELLAGLLGTGRDREVGGPVPSAQGQTGAQFRVALTQLPQLVEASCECLLIIVGLPVDAFV